MSEPILGIDIGGTSVKAAVLANDRWEHFGQSQFYSRPSASQLRGAILEAVGSVPATAAVGLCVPGLMDANKTRVTLSVNVPGLMGLELSSLAPEALGWQSTPATVISNDAAATGHDLFVSRKIAGRLLVLTLGTGVGSVVLDEGGKVLNVESGTSGHLGQIDVSIPGHDVTGPDGGAGGLEGYLGVAGLRRDYGNDLSLALQNFTGDEPAMLALVRALRIAHAIYRPQHICVCGGIGIRLKHLLPTLKAKIDRNLTSVARKDFTFTCGDDDFHAARGAARLAAHFCQRSSSV